MSSLSSAFEIHYQIVLDTACVFAVVLAAAIFIVTQAYRKRFKPLDNVYRKFDADPIFYRKPVAEENRDKVCCEVCDICFSWVAVINASFFVCLYLKLIHHGICLSRENDWVPI